MLERPLRVTRTPPHALSSGETPLVVSSAATEERYRFVDQSTADSEGAAPNFVPFPTPAATEKGKVSACSDHTPPYDQIRALSQTKNL